MARSRRIMVLAGVLMLARPGFASADDSEKDKIIRQLQAELANTKTELALTSKSLANSNLARRALENELDATNRNAAAAIKEMNAAREQLAHSEKKLLDLQSKYRQVDEKLTRLQAESDYRQRQIKLQQEEIGQLRGGSVNTHSQPPAATPPSPRTPRPDVEAKVSAVTRRFVTLDKGSAAGVKVNQQFAIRRGGQTVARIHVLSVLADSANCVLDDGAGVEAGDVAVSPPPATTAIGKVTNVSTTPATPRQATLHVEFKEPAAIQAGMTVLVTDNLNAAVDAMARAPQPSAGAERSPDGPPIKGQIVAVADDMATINVGKEDGVAAGMRFTVFRGPTYVAMLTVERVDAEKSIGRLDLAKSKVQIGDSAWNRLDAF